ncbi:MAG: undecaprenyldiphospho-muramoylpentapeptide beta-N-acetylglucosaminyltransferase [Mariprofundaceae bacterium]|nr:undecaprenyldiphospho-muramoylpentapeptide beta-N-acetylglucosaminyltransferase [Mariprofundaceae bacterium]
MTIRPVLSIAGGGTGGHVMPALALADAARQAWPALKVQFIGAERGLEATLLPERGEELLLLSMHSVQGAGLAQKLRVLLWELPRAVWQIRSHWKSEPPHLVVGVGGYASVTGVLAALLSRIPVVLYEQNAVPGMVNRKLVRFCKKIMLGFAEAARLLPAEKSVMTGNVVRENIAAIRWQPHTPPRLLVLGGSQGAAFLNDHLPAACRLLKQKGLKFEVTHIAGERGAEAVSRAYREASINAEVLGFCSKMPEFYASGDMMVSRSGAMTVGEAAICGMPAIFVPLPHAADNHQYYNARAMAERDAAIIVEQKTGSVSALADAIEQMLFDPHRLAAMSRAAGTWAVADARARQLKAISAYLPLSEVNA